MMKRLNWFVAVGTFLGAVAEAPGLDPPESKPAWWTDPPSGTTRLIYRSFKNDPDQPADPDYDRNGYEPDTGDNWINGGAPGMKFSLPPRSSDWGDGEGLLLAAGSQFTFEMQNTPAEELAKLTFTQMAWKPQTGDNDQAVDMTVHTWDGDQGSQHWFTSYDFDGWYLDTWINVLTPQPEWEDFRFEIKEGIQVDSVWIGVHCILSGDSNFDRAVDDSDLSLLLANWTGSTAVPEPATLSLLAVGALVLRHKRRP